MPFGIDLQPLHTPKKVCFNLLFLVSVLSRFLPIYLSVVPSLHSCVCSLYVFPPIYLSVVPSLLSCVCSLTFSGLFTCQLCHLFFFASVLLRFLAYLHASCAIPSFLCLRSRRNKRGNAVYEEEEAEEEEEEEEEDEEQKQNQEEDWHLHPVA